MKLPWGLRWWELLPEAVLGAGLTLFLVTETSAATSALKSGTAIRLMLLVSVAWLAVRFLLVRYTRAPLLRLFVFAFAAAAVLDVVVLPAYDDETVVEALPTAGSTPPPAATGGTTPPTSTTTLPATSTSAPTTTVATEPAPPASAPPASAPATPAPAPAPATTVPTTTTVVPAPTAPPEPIALRAAEIHGIDHDATGRAVIYRLPDGALVVGLEEIDIQPGPDYDVYVVPGAGRESVGDGIRLDDLRGNKGTQYYVVPAGTDVSTGEWTVLVWCQTFDVPVAGATPLPL